ncbi:glycosyltransferase [Catenuloplanes japonicus]|uniref:glycosyltransferase n=1 Tax=Catenuloplanes japonicus TaxID=33876 RepID=UPI00052443EB|nr:glycosyltransferase [Catenuloplanes japonicus]
MRVVILAVGTRGDVEPALALAWRLRSRDHEVALAVPVDLVPFAREAGFDATPVSLDTREFLESPDGQRFLAAGNSREYVRLLVTKKREVIRAVHADLTTAVKGADVVIGTRLVEEEGSSLAEWLGVPFIALHYFPTRSNPYYASPFVTARRLPAPLTRLTHQLFERTQWRHNAADVNRLRADLGLPPVTRPATVRFARAGILELQAYSRFLTPELADRNPRRPLIGPLRLEPEHRALIRTDHADPELTRWLDAGDPPVYIGFGSQPVLDGPRLVEEIRRTATRLGVRVLLNAGWSNLALPGADPQILLRRAVDHERIFPRCRIAVHHGGAGSTAASIGAGLPTVICADFADRALWGRAVTRLGVGTTIPLAALTATTLSTAIAPLLLPAPARRAQAIAANMATEDATTRAVEIIETR